MTTNRTADSLPIVRTLVAADGTTAEIHKHSSDTYALVITSRPTGHCRFGTLAEINADADHFLTTGKLPRSTSQSWF